MHGSALPYDESGSDSAYDTDSDYSSDDSDILPARVLAHQHNSQLSVSRKSMGAEYLLYRHSDASSHTRSVANIISRPSKHSSIQKPTLNSTYLGRCSSSQQDPTTNDQVTDARASVGGAQRLRKLITLRLPADRGISLTSCGRVMRDITGLVGTRKIAKPGLVVNDDLQRLGILSVSCTRCLSLKQRCKVVSISQAFTLGPSD